MPQANGSKVPGPVIIGRSAFKHRNIAVERLEWARSGHFRRRPIAAVRRSIFNRQVLTVCLLDSIKAVLLPQCKLKGGTQGCWQFERTALEKMGRTFRRCRPRSLFVTFSL